jgi:hypothetical protein
MKIVIKKIDRKNMNKDHPLKKYIKGGLYDF